MTENTTEQVIAEAYVQSWDQHIGQDGAIAVLNALRAAGLTITPVLTTAEVELRRKSDKLWAGAMVRAAYEDAAKIADGCATGVAVELSGNTFPLGVMANDPASAQKATAVAIASAIRARANGGKSP